MQTRKKFWKSSNFINQHHWHLLGLSKYWSKKKWSRFWGNQKKNNLRTCYGKQGLYCPRNLSYQSNLTSIPQYKGLKFLKSTEKLIAVVEINFGKTIVKLIVKIILRLSKLSHVIEFVVLNVKDDWVLEKRKYQRNYLIKTGLGDIYPTWQYRGKFSQSKMFKNDYNNFLHINNHSQLQRLGKTSLIGENY